MMKLENFLHAGNIKMLKLFILTLALNVATAQAHSKNGQTFDAPEKPRGNWEEVQMRDIDTRQLQDALDVNLGSKYTNFRLRTKTDERVSFKLGWEDLNGDRLEDALIFVESPYHCGAVGCTLLVYTAPFSQNINPYADYDPLALIDIQAMDVFVDTSVNREVADILIYKGYENTYQKLEWEERDKKFSP